MTDEQRWRLGPKHAAKVITEAGYCSCGYFFVTGKECRHLKAKEANIGTAQEEPVGKGN